MKNNVELQLEKYTKMINYLVNDVYNSSIRADIKQELLMFLFNFLNKKKKEINNKNYIFICLKNKRSELLKSSKYQSLVYLDENELDKIQTKSLSSEETYLRDHLYEFIESNLCKEDLDLIQRYFFNQDSMSQIAKKKGVSQQAVSKKISKIITYLNNQLYK